MTTTTLAERLEIAAQFAKVSRPELGRAAGITPAGMSKLFSGKTAEIKALNAFAIARRCGVDAEWLVTGKGNPPGQGGVREKRGTYNALSEFEPKHIDLLRMYKRLPDEVRGPIRAMIETLAAAQREEYHDWIRRRRQELADA